ncbi:MAG: UvrD-helicase domain-containing protein [Pirellulaceae bacterium]|nr:UvrD-helicase domain-containing protein [Pirellulaceae bacterium]
MPADLNPAQRHAVTTLRGPLLVLAGAGTGKTRVVTYRVAELIRTGTPPERILAVTFTNKAAAEMQQRIGKQLGKRLTQRPRTCTFHSHCVQVLRRHAEKLGLPARFTICDWSDQITIARGVLRDIRVSDTALKPQDLLSQISRWKCHGRTPADAAAQAAQDKEHLAAAGYRRYQQAMRNAGAVDFDDLLMYTEELFSRFPVTRREEAELFDHLLVDEYQDTNGSQYRIVKALARDHRNLCVVGDDDQSIYGWRGAEVEHILHFTRDWPDAVVVRLEENYRSTAAILEQANRLIAFNKTRHAKTLQPARPGGEKPRILQFKSETEEAQGVVEEIARLVGKPEWDPRDFAILFRTNEQPRAFETELRRAKLPYVLLGSTSFFDRKEVRDMLALLRLADHPRDELHLRRIINTPPRGLGPKTVERLLETAASSRQPLWNVLAEQAAGLDLPSAAQHGIRELVRVLRQFQAQFHQAAGGRGSLATLARQLIEQIGYEAEIRRLYDSPEEQATRWASVEEVVNALAAYEQNAESPRLTAFLDDLALSTRDFDNDKENQLRRNAVALLTVHSAKGLEFPHVYLVGMEEGILPHRRSVELEGAAIDEERRLCYVGITRAQERLTYTLARTRMKWGKPRETYASRFLYEIIGRPDDAPALAGHMDGPPPGRAAALKRRPGSQGRR